MADQHVPTPLAWTIETTGRGKQISCAWLRTPTSNILAEVQALTAEGRMEFPRTIALIATAPKLLRVMKVITDRDASSEAFLAALTEGRQIIAEAEGRTDG